MKAFSQQHQQSRKWMSLFKSLPIGMLVTKGDEIVRSNKLMNEMVGADKIEVSESPTRSFFLTF